VLDPSAQAKARKGTSLEPNDLPLMSTVFAMYSFLQLSLAAASKNNALGCFNEIPLTYKIHCIKAPPKEDSKRGKKCERDYDTDRNDHDKPQAKDNIDKGFFTLLKVGSYLFDQQLPQLPMISARVKSTIKQCKVCKDYCT
jgi:hypothetical protein